VVQELQEVQGVQEEVELLLQDLILQEQTQEEMVEQVLQQHQYLEQHHNLFMDQLQEFMLAEVEVEHTQLQVEIQVEQVEQVEVDQVEQMVPQVELLE
jgi:hypothetical protein